MNKKSSSPVGKDHQDRRKRPKGNAKKEGFIRAELTPSEKLTLEAQDTALEYPYSDIEFLVNEGYKFSLSYREPSDSFCATLYDGHEGSATQGYALSGWGATAHDAFSALLFKHRVKLSDGWAAYVTPSTPSRFG